MSISDWSSGVCSSERVGQCNIPRRLRRCRRRWLSVVRALRAHRPESRKMRHVKSLKDFKNMNKTLIGAALLASFALAGCGTLSKVDPEGKTDNPVFPAADDTSLHKGSYPYIKHTPT